MKDKSEQQQNANSHSRHDDRRRVNEDEDEQDSSELTSIADTESDGTATAAPTTSGNNNARRSRRRIVTNLSNINRNGSGSDTTPGNANTSNGDDLRRGGNTSHNTGCRLIHDEDLGKIRPTSSRDTVSTASLSHFDGNSSTGTLSMSQQNQLFHHPRNNRHRHGRRNPRVSRRLYNRQLNILLSSTGISLFLFLFFFMNIFAFTALMSFVVSIFMLVYTSYGYIMYLIQSGEVNVFTLLPEATRNRIMNTSIHEYFTDNSGYMENRFLLLYFIPGLTPDQILQMVNRLPQRHRDLVLNPGGLARAFAPSLVNSNNNSATSRSMRIVSASAENQSIPENHLLPLPVIEEGDEDTIPPVDNEEESISNQDAMRAIFNTARSLITGNASDDSELYVDANNQDSQEYNDLSWEQIDSNDIGEDDEVVNNDEQSQDSDSSDLGLDVSSDALTGNLPDGRLHRIARLVGLQQESSSSSRTAAVSNRSPPTTVTTLRPVPDETQLSFRLSSPSQEIEEEPQLSLEEERNLEGEIIDEAVSTVLNSYYNMATSSITALAANIVEGVTPSIIRTGIRLTSMSGLGLLGILSSQALNARPMSVMGRSITSRNLAEGRAGRFAIRSLSSTLLFGMFTVGSAYFTRAAVRRQRASIRNNSNNEDKDQSEHKKNE